MEDAVVVEENIKEIWKANSDPELRWALDDGTADLLQGNKERALETFTQLAVDDPNYAEAWNKKSTCHFMLGDMESSLEAAKQTLELQPDHFQALNGLGLVIRALFDMQYSNRCNILSTSINDDMHFSHKALNTQT